MTDAEKLLFMFIAVHGEATLSCYTEIQYNDSYDPIAVALMKDGHIAWLKTKEDILFDYLTKDFK